MNAPMAEHPVPANPSRLRPWPTLLSAALALLSLASPAGSVTIEQTPPIVQKPLPPNIVLMQDDSGSMAWDWMPDACYLTGVNCTSITWQGRTATVDLDALRYSGNNGIYYNPDVTYTPPPQAAASSYYSNAAFPKAWLDGFNQTSGDITTYAPPIEDSNGYDLYTSSGTAIKLQIYITVSTPTSSYTATSPCSSGYTYTATGGTGDYGACIKTYSATGSCSSSSYNYENNSCYYNASDTNVCGNGYTLKNVSNGKDYCKDKYGNRKSPTCYDSGTYGDAQNKCTLAPIYSCPSSKGGGELNDTTCTITTDAANPCPTGGTYESGTNTCILAAARTDKLFTYSTPGSTTGTYIRHYVAAEGVCSLLSSAYKDTCDDSSSARQNVANWFSYYRTRILMAKSGLMKAFSSLASTYRFGFGSINGNNDGSSPKPSEDYGSATLAPVGYFGDGSQTTDRKTQFWSWLKGLNANGGTPLQRALDGVGQYYLADAPWQTITQSDGTSASASEYACRQSYTILTSDGFWNGSDPRNEVKQADSTDGATLGSTTIDGKSGYIPNPKGAPYRYTAQAPYSGPYKDTSGNLDLNLADVAMYYWKNDLRSESATQNGKNNIVPTTPNDPAYWQHMVTFTVGLGFSPVDADQKILDKSAIFQWAHGGTSITDFAWPNPSSNNIANIADLLHAAVNGHGDFFSAKKPDEFAKGIQSALNSIGAQLGAGAGVSVSSGLLEAGIYQFAANYYTQQWTGELQAYEYNKSGCTATDAVGFCKTPTWSASAMLPTAANRNIWSWSGTSGKAVEFTSTNRATLGLPESTTVNSKAYDTTAIIDYLRGDQSKEIGSTNGTLRSRKSLLGDIISSKPVYIGAPSINLYKGKSFAGLSDYPTFVLEHKNDPGIIYVAANDGMLHAFNVKTNDTLGDGGKEIYAYMPGALLKTSGQGAISNLAHPDYGAMNPVDGTQSVPHQYYHDGKLTVASAYFGSKWHRILVGTTGLGPAKAIYALDITDPSLLIDSTKADDLLLWERSASDGKTGSSYIGQMTGYPVIAQTSNGSWSVFVGNGYNSAQDSPALLQFDLVTGDLSVHTTSTTGAGLSGPGLYQATATNGISTHAYAGDSKGNVYSFDLSSSTSSGTRIFTTQPPSGSTTQPVTAPMLVVKNAEDQTAWIFFGTGKFMAAADKEDLSDQTWYGLRVQSPSISLPTVSSTSVLSNLTKRSIVAQETSTVSGVSYNRATSLATDGDMTGKQGWYLPLVSSSTATIEDGERIVDTSQIASDGLLQVTTLIPAASGLCSTYPQGAFMRVDPFTGANTGKPSLDSNGDGVLDEKDASSTGIAFNGLVFGIAPAGPPIAVSKDGKTYQLFQSMDASKAAVATPSGSGIAGRISWRELTD